MTIEQDKRNRQPPIPENLRQVLNRQQIAALKVIQSLGWRLKFVRRPLFMEAQPVVYNARFDQVGVLDPDGNISMEVDLKIRPDQPAQEATPPAREEKRHGMAPIPGNVEALLNELQLNALRQIETFGWKLHFVRRPLFQEPVAGIISPEGGKLATLEADGRINLLPDSAVRSEDTIKPEADTEAPQPEPRPAKTPGS